MACMRESSFFLRMAKISTGKHSSIKMDDLVSFFQNMATLLNSGLPLLSSIRMCADQTESAKLSKIASEMATRIASGASFYQAAAEHTKVFNPHWVQMIRTGEITGQLALLMNELSHYITKVRETRNKVKSAMMYPITLLTVASIAIMVMLAKVIPTFADFFKSFGNELPQITQTVIAMSQFVQDRWMFIIGGVVGGIVGFKSWVATERGKRLFTEICFALPLVGDLTVQSAMEQFATNLSIMLKAGTPLLDALNTIQDIYHNNPVYKATIRQVHLSVSRGSSMAKSMEETGMFTNLVVGMAKTGEESGKLPQVMETVAGYYREKVATIVERLTGIMEPAIVVGMGVVVCAMLAAVYIPMFQMAGGPSGK